MSTGVDAIRLLHNAALREDNEHRRAQVAGEGIALDAAI
jgi:hypothetical protein